MLKVGDLVMVGDAQTGYYPGIIVDVLDQLEEGEVYYEVSMDGYVNDVHEDLVVDVATFDYEMQHGVVGA